MSLLDRLNCFENANIKPEDPYFYFTINNEKDEIIYKSSNLSWKELHENGLMLDGEINKQAKAWFPFIEKYTSRFPYGRCCLKLYAFY
jgi:hypothetical protein